MNQETFNKLLSAANAVQNEIKEDIKNDSFDVDSCLKASYLGNELCTKMRKFVIENSVNRAVIEDFDRRTYKADDIKINYENSVFSIEMPPLLHIRLPEERYFRNGFDGIILPLFLAINDYLCGNEVKRYEEKVLIFIQNVVDKNTKRRNIPDTDNREYKDVVNTICCKLLYDDDFKRASFYLDSIIGAESKTIIKIIPLSFLSSEFLFNF